MFSRYPHTGVIVSKQETQDANGDFVESETRQEIGGRYEPAQNGKDIDYNGKFFCKLLDLKPFEIDEKAFEYKSKRFTITQFHNYQTHCELWLT